MSELFSKFKDLLLGVDVEDDDYDDEDYYEEDYDDEEDYDYDDREEPQQVFKPRIERGRGTAYTKPVTSQNTSNVVDLHKKTLVDVNLPKSIEDARDVIDNTKSNIISIVNLEGIDSALAQRIADFLSGSVDALDGTIKRLSYDIFIIAPYGVEITGSLNTEIKKELKSSGVSLPWLNSAFS